MEMKTQPKTLFQLNKLESGYGKKQVLYGISLEIRAGEVVSLIGPNGAGKSTVLKAACGLIPAWKGEIQFNGLVVNGSTPAQNVEAGITFAPQGNRVFDQLSVKENLWVGGFLLPKQELERQIEEVVQLFPVLKDRMNQSAGRLSGGEQQMLALARAMMPKPKLLLLDEPSLGLYPALAKDVFAKISEISQNTGVAILVVEQKVREILKISHRVYSIRLGQVSFSGQPEELIEDHTKLSKLFL